MQAHFLKPQGTVYKAFGIGQIQGPIHQAKKGAQENRLHIPVWLQDHINEMQDDDPADTHKDLEEERLGIFIKEQGKEKYQRLVDDQQAQDFIDSKGHLSHLCVTGSTLKYVVTLNRCLIIPLWYLLYYRSSTP